MLCYALLCYALHCFTLLCLALLGFAMLCFALLCFAMLCYTSHCFNLLCYALLCYALLCYALHCFYFALLCFALLCFALLCFAMLCIALLCFAMLSFATVCFAMLCFAMLCMLYLTPKKFLENFGNLVNPNSKANGSWDEQLNARPSTFSKEVLESASCNRWLGCGAEGHIGPHRAPWPMVPWGLYKAPGAVWRPMGPMAPKIVRLGTLLPTCSLSFSRSRLSTKVA